MTAEDLTVVLAWRNHPDIRRFMYTTHEITMEEHRRWFERTAGDPNKMVLIFECDGIRNGFVQFSRHKVSRVADWGFYVAPDAPKGTGRRLGQTAIDYAFTEWGLHKICGQALAFNEPSVGFHQAMGYRQEGCLREQHFDGNHYHDVLCFGLLSSEWALEKRKGC